MCVFIFFPFNSVCLTTHNREHPWPALADFIIICRNHAYALLSSEMVVFKAFLQKLQCCFCQLLCMHAKFKFRDPFKSLRFIYKIPFTVHIYCTAFSKIVQSNYYCLMLNFALISIYELIGVVISLCVC